MEGAARDAEFKPKKGGDLKSQTKTWGVKRAKDLKETGVGHSRVILSPLEEKILTLISNTLEEGIPVGLETKEAESR